MWRGGRCWRRPPQDGRGRRDPASRCCSQLRCVYARVRDACQLVRTAGRRTESRRQGENCTPGAELTVTRDRTHAPLARAAMCMCRSRPMVGPGAAYSLPQARTRRPSGSAVPSSSSVSWMALPRAAPCPLRRGVRVPSRPAGGPRACPHTRQRMTASHTRSARGEIASIFLLWHASSPENGRAGVLWRGS